MSLIATRLGLTHTCTIERNGNAAVPDSWGQPGAPGWETHLADQPCFAWARAGRERVADSTTVAAIEDLRLLLPFGTDVTEQDRIVSVEDRGATLHAGPLQIRAVLAHEDHLELVLTKVS